MTKILSKFKSDEDIGANEILFNDKVYVLNVEKLITIGKVLNISYGELGLRLTDAIKTELTHEVFKRRGVVEELWNSVYASDVFSHVTGVILVNEKKGWMRISRFALDRILKFDRITQNLASFKAEVEL